MTWACLGCDRTFDTSKGLDIHRHSCKKFASTTRSLLLKRKQQQERPDAAKIARRLGEPTLAVVSNNISSEGASNEATVSLVRRNLQLPQNLNNFEQSLPNSSVRDTTLQTHQPEPPRPLFSTRSQRTIRCPKAYQDFLPSSATPVTQISRMAQPVPQRVTQAPPSLPQPSSPPPQNQPPPLAIDTEPNDFGIYRSYTKWPTLDPEDAVGLAEVCDSTGLEGSGMNITSSQSAESNILSPSLTPSTTNVPFDPFPNATTFRLMNWWYGGSTMKSAAELDRLVNDVLLQDDFSQEHLRGFSCAREAGRLDRHRTAHTTLSPSKGWIESTVKITLPAEHTAKGSEPQSAEYDIPGVFHRSLTEIVKEAFQDPVAQTFHLTPFKQLWKHSNNEPPVRLHSELYTSDAMLEEYNKISSSPGEPGCNLERVVASIMV
jgi:hypothetical protein